MEIYAGLTMNSADLIHYGNQFAHYGLDIAIPRNKFIATASCAAGYVATRAWELWGRAFMGDSIADRFTADSNSIWHGPSKIVGWGFAIISPTKEAADQFTPLVGIGTALAVSITLNGIALVLFGRKKHSAENPHPLTEVLEKQSAKSFDYKGNVDSFGELVGFDPMAGVAHCWHPCR
jgi:hypothetical protein